MGTIKEIKSVSTLKIIPWKPFEVRERLHGVHYIYQIKSLGPRSEGCVCIIVFKIHAFNCLKFDTHSLRVLSCF